MEKLRVPATSGSSTLTPPTSLASVNACSPNRRKISFARLAACVLHVKKTRRKASRAREEELLQAAENGDVARIRNLVLSCDVNTDATDQLGRTPLHLAVVNDRKDAVRFLLDHVEKRRVYQALLSAINLGNEEIAELIIEHEKYGEISGELQRRGSKALFLQQQHNSGSVSLADDNQFSEEITPLILAAQQNRFEVVMALLLKKESIEKPHRCHCTCDECCEQSQRDELKFARSRLNAYRGLASEAYISLSSDDPIMTSFRLRRELQGAAREEKYYTAEYSLLANRLSEYVVRLLDKVHGNDELNAILNATDANDDTYRTPHELARLQLAIEYKEKKFVAHPSCQKKLTTLWYGEFYKLLKRRSNFVQISVISIIALLYPLLAFVYFLAPRSSVGKLLKTPCVKFIAQATSYLLFLCLIVAHGHNEQYLLCPTRLNNYTSAWTSYGHVRQNLTKTHHVFDKMCVRNHTPTFVEWCILLWITGLLWHACKQVYSVGVQSHFVNIYNAVDFFMLESYMASLTLRRLTDVEVRTSLNYFSQSLSWQKLVASDSTATYRLYWINADRFYWDAWDPVHVSEAMLAVGNILNFSRLFHLLAINEHLGPMLISLERMIKDVMRFMVTFVPIFLAFMVGMYNLYWYYDPSVRSQVEVINHNIQTRAQEGFGNLELTFRTIFWALFGLKDAKTVELGEGFQSRFTESVGYIVFGVYNWGAVIVLLNMLIAMMTRSFDKIATDQDIEWKYVRSKLYMEYIRIGSTLPVPFNVFPSLKSIMRLLCRPIRWCHLIVCKHSMNASSNALDNNFSTLPLSVTTNTIFTCSSSEQVNINCQTHTDDVVIHPATDDARVQSQGQGPSISRTKTLRALSSSRSMTLGVSTDWNVSLDQQSVFGDNDECRIQNQPPVVKTVVRRYIFEHLLASVTPNEGNLDLDNVRQQANNILNELNELQPRIADQFAMLADTLKVIDRTTNEINQRQLLNRQPATTMPTTTTTTAATTSAAAATAPESSVLSSSNDRNFATITSTATSSSARRRFEKNPTMSSATAAAGSAASTLTRGASSGHSKLSLLALRRQNACNDKTSNC